MIYKSPRGKPTHNEYKKLVNWNILATKFKKSTEILLVVASENGLGLKDFILYSEKTENVLQNTVKVL